MADSKRQLTGRQKAAILLMMLGPDLAGEIYKRLSEKEVEQVTREIANLPSVNSKVQDLVVEEFHRRFTSPESADQGGLALAKAILVKALGEQKAEEIIERLTGNLHVRPFSFARRTDPAELLGFIQNEHPQTIALILAHLHPDQAGRILSELPSELQVDVARRLAILDRTAPEVLEEVERSLERRLSTFVTHDDTAAGGIDVAVDVLNRVDRATEKTIMEALSEEDPDLAEEIKKRLFVFEDIALLDDRDIQRIVREVSANEWALALKTASEEVTGRIMRNMSKRAAELLKEEMEYLGPVRLRDVEEAQQRVVAHIRRLEEAGEIVVVRGGEDEIFV